MVLWIQAERSGGEVRLVGADDLWSDGWEVVGDLYPIIDRKSVVELNRAHLKQRAASDI